MSYQQPENNKENYIQLIAAIKMLNREKKLLMSSREYKLGCSMSNKAYQVRNYQFQEILKSYRNNIRNKKNRKNTTIIHRQNNGKESNYFLDKRIAVYTCITGGYDSVIEPIVLPDNCDYYLITDNSRKRQSAWKSIEIGSIGGNIKSLPNAMQNRYIKMFPDIVFPNYEYSIYIDGSIRICTDMTEYVNRITHYGMAFFLHDQRDCVYDEINACITLGKSSKRELIDHKKYLQSQSMPHNYGLPACGVIARKHHDLICKKVMKEWWEEYVNHVKRDQLSLPLILYRNHIDVVDITQLGDDMYRDDSFEFRKHNIN